MSTDRQQPAHQQGPPLRCLICPQLLTGDREDQPDPPLGPMCGECYRAQQMDDEIDAQAFLDQPDLDF